MRKRYQFPVRYILMCLSLTNLITQVLFEFISNTDACSTYFEDRVPRIFSENSEPSARLSIWLKDLVSFPTDRVMIVVR